MGRRIRIARDYVLGLFDRYDVVVLCERLHPEASQWEFILDLLSDPRFQARLGPIFTEYGSMGMQDYLDKFMATDAFSDASKSCRERVVVSNLGLCQGTAPRPGH